MNEYPVYRTALIVTDPVPLSTDTEARDLFRMVFDPEATGDDHLRELIDLVEQYKEAFTRTRPYWSLNEVQDYKWSRRVEVVDEYGRLRAIREFRIIDFIDMEEDEVDPAPSWYN